MKKWDFVLMEYFISLNQSRLLKKWTKYEIWLYKNHAEMCNLLLFFLGTNKSSIKEAKSTRHTVCYRARQISIKVYSIVQITYSVTSRLIID